MYGIIYSQTIGVECRGGGVVGGEMDSVRFVFIAGVEEHRRQSSGSPTDSTVMASGETISYT